jgi:hypothetical protein
VGKFHFTFVTLTAFTAPALIHNEKRELIEMVASLMEGVARIF